MSTFFCANCAHGNPPKAQFCNACGQVLHVHRIDASYLWHELQHGLLHVDKGILFTTKELLKAPGRTVQRYLAGQRAAHFKPVGYLIVCGTIFTVLKSLLPGYTPRKTIVVSEERPPLIHWLGATANWLLAHPAIMVLLLLLPLTYGIYLAFRRRTQHSYLEILILVVYLVGLTFALRIPLRLLGLISGLKEPLNFLGTGLAWGYIVWGPLQFFAPDIPSVASRVLRFLWGLVLTGIMFLLTLLAGATIAALSIALYKNGGS